MILFDTNLNVSHMVTKNMLPNSEEKGGLATASSKYAAANAWLGGETANAPENENYDRKRRHEW